MRERYLSICAVALAFVSLVAGPAQPGQHDGFCTDNHDTFCHLPGSCARPDTAGVWMHGNKRIELVNFDRRQGSRAAGVVR